MSAIPFTSEWKIFGKRESERMRETERTSPGLAMTSLSSHRIAESCDLD